MTTAAKNAKRSAAPLQQQPGQQQPEEAAAGESEESTKTKISFAALDSTTDVVAAEAAAAAAAASASSTTSTSSDGNFATTASSPTPELDLQLRAHYASQLAPHLNESTGMIFATRGATQNAGIEAALSLLRTAAHDVAHLTLFPWPLRRVVDERELCAAARELEPYREFIASHAARGSLVLLGWWPTTIVKLVPVFCPNHVG